MDISRILLFFFATSLFIGAFDYFRGNRWHLGECFLAGIRAFEPLFLSMAGILALIPLFRRVLVPVLAPCFTKLGIDPSVFAGLFLASDMGAYPLALTLTSDQPAAAFSGMLLGSVLGVNLVFTLPAALKIVQPEDRPYLFRGLLFGFITVPAGCLTGGLTAGCAPGGLFRMMIPVVFIAAVSSILLLTIPDKLSVFLAKLGRAVEGIALLGITLSITSELTGFANPEFLEPIQSGIKVVGSIAIILPGAYVLIRVIDRIFHPLLNWGGRLLGINETAVLGMFTSLANSIPTFQMIRDMDPRGKTFNFAFLSAGAFSLGDHLAYCCAVAPELAFPLLVTKFTAAFLAVIVAAAFYRWCPRVMSESGI